MKDFADDNFRFDKNGRKLSKPVENTVGKGEIARYEQFLLFPQCFQKACFPEASKGVIVWEWEHFGEGFLTCNKLFIISRGPGFELHWILWAFLWDCLWARHFRFPA